MLRTIPVQSQRRPRIGLALGAGGVLGGAWLASGLAAIYKETGWSPSDADHIMGTSAGSVFAALTAAQIPPHRLLPAGMQQLGLGKLTSAEIAAGESWLLMELNSEAAYRIPRTIPRPLPGSLGMVWNSLREPLKAVSGLAPEGTVSTGPIRRTIRHAVPEGWAPHPGCFIVACDYATGKRVAFGAPDAPRAELADAVAASCAIPGFFRPVRIGGRLYVDGGLHSMSNLDLFSGLGLDLVICLNPLSARAGAQGWNPLNRMAAALRSLATRQVDAEVDRLLAEGTDVVLIEPTAADMAAIGDNVMDARRGIEVVRTGLQTVSEQLRQPDVREMLQALPVSPKERARRTSRVAAVLRRAGLGAAAAF